MGLRLNVAVMCHLFMQAGFRELNFEFLNFFEFRVYIYNADVHARKKPISLRCQCKQRGFQMCMHIWSTFPRWPLVQFVLAFVFPTGEENRNSFTSQEEESYKNRSKHVPLALPSRPLCNFAFSSSTLCCFPWMLFGHVL